MKTTGIVRRIDELGRIVIPKEIRKNLRIKSGENIEIYVENESIILKKNSPLDSQLMDLDTYIEAFQSIIKKNVLVSDRSKIITAFGSSRKKYLNNEISEYSESLMERRDSYVERQKKEFSLIKNITEEGYFSFSTIVNNGDILGSIIIVSNDIPISEEEEKVAIILSKIFSKYFID